MSVNRSIILIHSILLTGYHAFMPVHAQIITVKQDGTGDFTMIQNAVNASFNGDTVLVYPGTYYENLDLTSKGIVLAGTWLLNPEDSLVFQTIIDGNHYESCIKSLSGSLWTHIIGFTIQNGFGTNLSSYKPYYYGNGGGILVVNSKIKVIECRVCNNFGKYGAGICATNSSLELSGNSIFNNWAVKAGGGIRIASSEVIIDSVDLNNVYLNYASYGSDIEIAFSDTPSKIYLDTATVINPDDYYIGKFNDWAVLIERPPVSVLHGKIGQVNQDVFVSTLGDNDNSGLTPDDPLKTISFALLKIASDSVNVKTVHVADGIYSHQLTGEHTPLQLKNFVILAGQSIDNTIIDCEGKYEGARFAFGQDYTMLKNLTFINGNGNYTGMDGGISTGYSKTLVLDSVAFIRTTGEIVAVIYSDSDDSLIVRNSRFEDCSAHYTIECFVNPNDAPRYNEFVSCTFSGNHVDSAIIPEWEGRHVTLGLQGLDFEYGWNNTLVMNCLFNDNTDSFVWTSGGGAVAIVADYGCHVDLVNSTITRNLTINNPSGGAIGASNNSTVNFYNSILFDNYACQAYLANDAQNEADTMIVNYTLIQDGLSGIRDYGAYNHFFWGDGNLDSDPLFLGTEQYPYAIDIGSPCIDAGTLDLPPGIELPEYDLSGNPRIWGESVDMGAYEYGPWVGVGEVGGRRSVVGGQMSANPNPFSYGSYISYELQSSGRLNISVFSISGMKVRTLENHHATKSYSGKLFWNGTDDHGNEIPSGVYLIRMTIDGKEVETVRLLRSRQ